MQYALLVILLLCPCQFLKKCTKNIFDGPFFWILVNEIVSTHKHTHTNPGERRTVSLQTNNMNTTLDTTVSQSFAPKLFVFCKGQNSAFHCAFLSLFITRFCILNFVYCKAFTKFGMMFVVLPDLPILSIAELLSYRYPIWLPFDRSWTVWLALKQLIFGVLLLTGDV